MTIEHIVFTAVSWLASLAVIFAVGYRMGKRVACHFVRKAGVRYLRYDEMGVILGAIKGRPAEWCAMEAAQKDYDETPEGEPFSEEKIERLVNVAMSEKEQR